MSLEDRELLLNDKSNKELELIYLEEIKSAQENEDIDAFNFYFKAYMDVPRLDVPQRLKSRPEYFEGGIRINY